MKKLTLDDVKNLHEYELIRDDWRREVIAVKERRRVLLGPKMSLVFENRLTVLNQVQEMCRIERLARPEAVQAELDVYNELLPGPGEVAATLFIEIPGEGDIRPELDRLVGLGRKGHLKMTVGGRAVPAVFLEGQEADDKISAVQYVRFPVGQGEDVRKAVETGPVSVVVDHPAYGASAVLGPETREELARDLLPG